MRIAICDNVPVYVEQMKKYIERWSTRRGFPVQLTTFQNGEEVLFALESEGNFTAVFMGSRIWGINGMEIAVQIRELAPQVSIVFVSRHCKYLNEISQVYPSQYIEKPVLKQKIFEALDNILKEQRGSFESFDFRYKRMTYSISLWQVLYFVSDKRRILIFTEDGKELIFYEKMDVLEEKISVYNHYFLRIHQSYLVNERQIEQVFSNQVRLRNGEMLPVSREKKSQVRSFCMKLQY